MGSVKLMDIVVDPTIQVREVEAYTVSAYAHAMRSGAKFPPLVIEAVTNRLVAGNHRYFAYKQTVKPETMIAVETRQFGSEAELIRFAAADNARHGRPLDTWDKKRIVARLRKLGDSAESIAELLGVSVGRVEEWAGHTVIVIGKRGKSTLKTPEPIKRGLDHMAGKEITREAYLAHERHDIGSPVKNLAAIITRHITDNLIDTEDAKTMENLEALHGALSDFFNAREAVA